MARGTKRKAMEELTPNSLPAIDFVRPVEEHPQTPHFIGRLVMSVRGAVSWLLNGFYTTTTHQNTNVVTDAHVQVVRSSPRSSTSIKRLKTTNSLSASTKPTTKQKPRSRSDTNTHPSTTVYKGGIGPVDIGGCTTEKDLEQCVDNFWLPQDWTKPRTKHLQKQLEASDQVRDCQAPSKNRSLDTFPDQNGDDFVMRDSDHDVEFAQMDGKSDHKGDYFTSSIKEPQSTKAMPTPAPPNNIPLPTTTSKREQQTMDRGTDGGPSRSTWTAYSLSRKPELQMDEIKLEDKLSQDIGALLLTEQVGKGSYREQTSTNEFKDDAKKDKLKDVKVEFGIDLGHEQESEGPEVKRPLKGILKKESKYDLKESVKKVDTHLRSSQDKKIKREASARQREKQEREAAAKAKKEARLYRRQPNGPLVKRLNTNWAAIVKGAMTKQGTITTSLGGTPLQQKDFGTLLGSRSWLNDEIINTYIEWLVDAANHAAENEAKVAGEKISSVPKFIAHNSFFYESLKNKGPQGTARLMKRKKAPGLSLLEVDSVFVPICKGAHWTLGVVRPFAKTIEYFDSMGGGSAHLVKLMRDWLAFQLGDAYVANEWTEPMTRCAVQHNGYDCGVFVCTNAFCVTAGIDTSSYLECHMTQQRQNIAAILMNRGFVGDFAWSTQV